MGLQKGQKVQPAFVRAQIGGQLHAVRADDVVADEVLRTLCRLPLVEEDVIRQRFQADMPRRQVCARCTAEADRTRQAIYRARHRLADRQVS